MKLMKWIIFGFVIGALAGCQQQSVQEAKIEANKHWLHTRAQMQYGVACEHLKVGQLDRARSKAMEALSLDEEYTEARLLLAKVCIEEGQYSTAVAELNKVARQIPRSAEPVYLLGVAQEKEGRLDEALGSYRKAFAMDNTHLPAVLAAGEVMVAMGQVRQAQIHVESYMNLAADEPGIYELAGRLAMMQKEYDKAAKYYQQARDLDFKNTLYQDALAKAQYLSGRYADAAESLKGLMEAAVRKEQKPAPWMYTMLGDCYVAINRPHNARDAYQVVTEMTPSDASAWANLAKAALKLGDLDRAVLASRQGLQADATNLDAALVLGYALVLDGQHAQAISVLKPAKAAHPASGTLLCLLGRAHAGAGDETEAARCYAAAVRLEPDNAAARELLNAAAAKKISMRTE